MICNNCKKEIPDGSKYCYYCGTIFEEQNTNTSSQSQADKVHTMGAYNSPQQQTGNMNPNNGYPPYQQAPNMNPNNGYPPYQQAPNMNSNNGYPPYQQAMNQNTNNGYYSPQQPLQKPKKKGKGLKVLLSLLTVFLIVSIIILTIILISEDAFYSQTTSISNSTYNNNTVSTVNSEPTIIYTTTALSYQPTNPSNVFYQDTPIIYSVYEISGFNSNTNLYSEWYYLDQNQLISSGGQTPGFKDGTAYFSLSIPDGGWTVGQYKVVTKIDGVKKHEEFFEIKYR